MGNGSPTHLSANLNFNLQIEMPKRKSRSETGLLNTLHQVPVSVVTNENCHSFGDAMRDLDAKGVLRHDFVLTSGDVVTNMRLSGVAEAHRDPIQ